jgi:hypothetical protein
MMTFNLEKHTLSDEQRIRIEFARLANVIFAHEMTDEDRRAYWEAVLEPVWSGLQVSWVVYGLPDRAEWDLVLRQALMPAESPSQWRARQPSKKASTLWRKAADKKAAKEVERIKARRRYVEDVLGQKERKPEANTKAFWQSQSFGPASPVRKIDPSTYKPDKD